MTHTADVAQALVRDYLNGRYLSRNLLDAIVWVAQDERAFTRPAQLTAPMRALIDRHAGALPVPLATPKASASASPARDKTAGPPAPQRSMVQWFG